MGAFFHSNGTMRKLSGDFMLYLLLSACGDSPKEESVEEKIDYHRELVRKLSARDNHITCSSLSAPQLQIELTKIVDTTERRPWVPMRAAACLTNQYQR